MLGRVWNFSGDESASVSSDYTESIQDEQPLVDPAQEETDDREPMLELKAYLQPGFTNNWVEGIREIRLESDNWNGVFAKRNSVRKLSLNAWGIESNLASLASYLQSMHHLESLSLDDNVSMAGNLSDLARLTNLRTLSIARSARVSGDLKDLAHMRHLRALFCDGTAVHGSLAGLDACTQLMVLSLPNTDVSGSLVDCAKFESLTWLMLSHTNITGKKYNPHGA